MPSKRPPRGCESMWLPVMTGAAFASLPARRTKRLLIASMPTVNFRCTAHDSRSLRAATSSLDNAARFTPLPGIAPIFAISAWRRHRRSSLTRRAASRASSLMAVLLFDFDVGGAHDLAPLRKIGADQFAHLPGRAAVSVAALREQLFLQFRGTEAFLHFGVEPRDDIARRSSGRHEAEPVVGFEAFQRFVECRQIGQRRRAFGRRNADAFQAPALHVRHGRGDAVEK